MDMIDLDSLVSAPLNAASKANKAMLNQQTQFLLATCFTVEQGIRTPVMVNMRLSRTGIDPTESQDMVFQVPLISLIPFNSLGVNRVDVDFNMDVHQTIPCPVCSKPIPFDLQRLLRSESFTCPQCDAKISLSPKEHLYVQNAIDKLDQLKKGND